MPNLTAKDFNRIAQALAELRAATLARVPTELVAQIGQSFYNAASDIALVLAEHNGKFDRARFLDAANRNGL